jgi:hydrogenase maturation protein HypF
VAGFDRACGYPARVEDGLLCGSDLIRGVVDDLRAGVEVPVIAARFHAGLADLLARAAVDACAATGFDTVALSGGVFQNVLLLRLLVAELEAAGLRVLTHSRVPPNDAGVSLGQVAVAAARDAAG